MPNKLLLSMLALWFTGAAWAAEATEVVVVVAKKHRFEPAEISIRPGTVVRWENREKAQFHSVFFPDLGDKPGDYFSRARAVSDASTPRAPIPTSASPMSRPMA